MKVNLFMQILLKLLVVLSCVVTASVKFNSAAEPVTAATDTQPEPNLQKQKNGDSMRFPDPPAWVENGVMYEVNLRQFSQAGTVAGFRPHLPRLKELGVDILWFMPIHPIGVEKRSGTLGSYYAVRDFTAFNEEFGSIEEFKHLVSDAQAMGFRVIIDWVANHTAPDHLWVTEHPDWYLRDARGDLVHPQPTWLDVVDLDFDNGDLRDAMIDAMSYWVSEVGVDGFRCDAAEFVPLDFWVEARDTLREIGPVFMLAEASRPDQIEYAFDALYAWHLPENLEGIVAGTKTVEDLVNYCKAESRLIGDEGFRLNFTTNHDLNSWEGTDRERLGDGIQASTVLTYMMPGMPLIYTGQEAGLDRQLAFFERDPIDWVEHPMTELYQELSAIKRRHPALAVGSPGSMQIIKDLTGPDVLAFIRQVETESGIDQVLTVLNLSPSRQQVRVAEFTDGLTPVLGHAELDGNVLAIDPWGFSVWATPAPKSEGN